MPYKMYFKKNSSFMIRDITSSCGDFCNLILASISILNDFNHFRYIRLNCLFTGIWIIYHNVYIFCDFLIVLFFIKKKI